MQAVHSLLIGIGFHALKPHRKPACGVHRALAVITVHEINLVITANRSSGQHIVLPASHPRDKGRIERITPFHPTPPPC